MVSWTISAGMPLEATALARPWTGPIVQRLVDRHLHRVMVAVAMASTLTIRDRPVMARIRWTASMVASVPELAKRHSGRPKRRRSSSATMMASTIGWAKWVPRRPASETAATTAGWACLTAMTP